MSHTCCVSVTLWDMDDFSSSQLFPAPPTPPSDDRPPFSPPSIFNADWNSTNTRLNKPSLTGFLSTSRTANLLLVQPDLLCDSLSNHLFVAVSFIFYLISGVFPSHCSSVWPQYLTVPFRPHTHDKPARTHRQPAAGELRRWICLCDGDRHQVNIATVYS